MMENIEKSIGWSDMQLETKKKKIERGRINILRNNGWEFSTADEKCQAMDWRSTITITIRINTEVGVPQSNL